MLIDLTKLHWLEFQTLMSDLFEGLGYKIEFASQVGPDGKKDIIISKAPDDLFREHRLRYVVSCKRHAKGSIGVTDVFDIRDTIEQNGAHGFILATTTRISQGLSDKIRELNIPERPCRVLLPHEIHDMITNQDQVFGKYFPEEARKYVAIRARLSKPDLAAYVEEKMGKNVSEEEVDLIVELAATHDVDSRESLSKALQDVDAEKVIKSRFETHLLREPTVPELSQYLIILSETDRSEWDQIVAIRLMNTVEFFSKVRIYAHFSDHPLCEIKFDAAHQEALRFRTYHADQKDGFLEIVESELEFSSHKRAARLRSVSDDLFTVTFPVDGPRLGKSSVTVDYTVDGTFYLYVNVIDVKGMLYQLRYSEGDTHSQVENRGSYTSINIQEPSMDNVSPLRRRQADFSDDLRRFCDTVPAELRGIIFGISGTVTLYDIIIA